MWTVAGCRLPSESLLSVAGLVVSDGTVDSHQILSLTGPTLHCHRIVIKLSQYCNNYDLGYDSIRSGGDGCSRVVVVV